MNRQATKAISSDGLTEETHKWQPTAAKDWHNECEALPKDACILCQE